MLYFFSRKKHSSKKVTSVLKVKDSSLELEKKIKSNNISIDDMDKFEEKELTNKRKFPKRTWYDWCDQ